MSQAESLEEMEGDEKMFVNEDDMKLLAENNVEIYKDDGLLGGGVEGQVYQGRFKEAWTHEIYDKDSEGRRQKKIKDVKIPKHAPVAVKFVVFSRDDHPQIAREVDTLKAINNPNLVNIYKCFWKLSHQHPSKCYVVMELALNTLFGYLDPFRGRAKKDKLSEEHLKGFIYDMVNGLEGLFATGRYHDDLNQHNFLVFRGQKRPIVKLVDVGMVKLKDTEEEQQLGQYKDLKDLSMIFFGLSQCVDLQGQSKAQMFNVLSLTSKKNLDPIDVCKAVKDHALLKGVEEVGETWPGEEDTDDGQKQLTGLTGLDLKSKSSSSSSGSESSGVGTGSTN